MRNILNVTLLLLIYLSGYSRSNKQKGDLLYNKQGKPSSEGIKEFIDKNQESIIAEYQSQIDTIDEVYIYSENLSRWNENELGEFNPPGFVAITNEERFIEYEYKYLSKYELRMSSYEDRTVKAVIFHELTHAYFNKIVISMNTKGYNVHLDYEHNFSYGLYSETGFGAQFIEEGICEYAIFYLNEAKPTIGSELIIPTTKEELIDETKEVNNKYYYSVYFLKDFLDKYGIKRGTEILITNKPPTYNEIINPHEFFARVIINDKI